MERYRPHRYSAGETFEFPPAKDVITGTEYSYNPQPIRPEPPISGLEFRENFYGCYEDNCLWRKVPLGGLWSRIGLCDPIGILPSDRISRIPKRDRPVVVDSINDSEIFWGIVARERISFIRVCVYMSLLLAATIVFGAGWLEGWMGDHSGDLQNAIVPITIVLGVLAVTWRK